MKPQTITIHCKEYATLKRVSDILDIVTILNEGVVKTAIETLDELRGEEWME